MALQKLLLVAMLLFAIACASNPKPQTSPGQPESKPESIIKVTPQISMAGLGGATVVIEYRIARHPDNRAYSVSWKDGGGPLGATGRSLNGENEPYVFPRIMVDHLHADDYEAKLTVMRIENGQEKEYTTSQRFTVQ